MTRCAWKRVCWFRVNMKMRLAGVAFMKGDDVVSLEVYICASLTDLY